MSPARVGNSCIISTDLTKLKQLGKHGDVFALRIHSGRLMALAEGGLPYALRVMCDGVIETIGQMSYDGHMKGAFTAHPKKDSATGKLHGFGYHVRG